MPLRPSQVETLRMVRRARSDRDGPFCPHGNKTVDVPRIGIEAAYAGLDADAITANLEGLYRSGHLERSGLPSCAPEYRLTQLGREALEGQK